MLDIQMYILMFVEFHGKAGVSLMFSVGGQLVFTGGQNFLN